MTSYTYYVNEVGEVYRYFRPLEGVEWAGKEWTGWQWDGERWAPTHPIGDADMGNRIFSGRTFTHADEAHREASSRLFERAAGLLAEKTDVSNYRASLEEAFK